MENAENEMGGDALLSSTVRNMNRCATDNVDVTVQTLSEPRLIRAKNIVCTIPPVSRKLKGEDLKETEIPSFDRFRYFTWYVGFPNNFGIPDTLTV